MTNQEKKQYLRRYQAINADINQMCEELSEWRTKATKITPTISDMPKSNGGENRLQGAVDHIVEIESKINARIDELVQAREEVLRVIEDVEDPDLRLLLKYRYINGLTWEKLAVEMSYTYRNVLYLHGKALNKLVFS